MVTIYLTTRILNVLNKTIKHAPKWEGLIFPLNMEDEGGAPSNNMCAS